MESPKKERRNSGSRSSSAFISSSRYFMQVQGSHRSSPSLLEYNLYKMKMQMVEATVHSDMPQRDLATSSIATDQWKKYSIYRVPSHMKAKCFEAYIPQLVSIGPYHHGKPHLLAMEEHKARALERFLNRTQKTFQTYCTALETLHETLMESYQALDDQWKGDVDRFIRLMVVDGSFLFEFMSGLSQGWDYEQRDPVFSFRAMLNIQPYIMTDILMLENQLPLLVLERLVAVAKDDQLTQQNGEEVFDLVSKFLSTAHSSLYMAPRKGYLHILDVSRKVITMGFPQISTKQHDPTGAVRSAMDLHGAGIKFMTSKSTGRHGGISFHKGILRLPTLTIDTTTKPHFLNAIAFENLHPSADREVSSYIAFIGGLVASADDANFLITRQLIQSEIGDEQAVVAEVKSISEDVFFDPLSDLCEVRNSLGKFYKEEMRDWRRQFCARWRSFNNIYLKCPWAIPTVAAAVVLNFFTVVQTVYTVIAYYKGDKSK